MASKPYNNPILSLKGYDNLYDLLNAFPFEICYKHICLITKHNAPEIPYIINKLKSIYRCSSFHDALISKTYYFESFLDFRLITSNGQIELTFEFNKNEH